MGGFFEYRDFLLALFPLCFFSSLLPGTEFCVSCVDFMQFLPGLVLSKHLHKDGFDIGAIRRRVEELVAHYQNNEDDPTRPIIRTALVVMLDTVHQVPKTKAATQKSRDQTEEPHMNEARYEELTREGGKGDLFIASGATRHPLKGSEVWRSNNLKMQLFREVTLQVLHATVRRDRVLVMDDGLAFSTDVYRGMREEMLTKSNFLERSPFEQECLVTNLLTHSKMAITRFILWEGGQYRRRPSTGTGEADIKILHYINTKNGARRFLVVNQDTDVIFILLLHLHKMVGDGDDGQDVEIWLDTHSPSNTSGVSKPYRYINIKRLYFSIIDLFKREYPSVPHPVEMFCFLVFTKKTDFIPQFAKCLCVGDADGWNLFSELHSGVEGGFLRFGTTPEKVHRSTEYRWSASLRGLLNYAVTYDWVKHRFLLNHTMLQKFYYLLLQDKVMTVRKKLRLPVPTSSALAFGPLPGAGRSNALEPEELLIYAHDVAERVEAYRSYMAKNETTMFQTLLNFKKLTPAPIEGEPEAKKFKLSESFGKRVATEKPVVEEEYPIEEDSTDEMETEDWSEKTIEKSNNAEPGMERYIRQNVDVLKLFTKHPYTRYYGVPTVTEMRARLYRLEFYMMYCRNGAFHGENMVWMPTQRSRLDDRLTVWGYCERRITDPEERRKALNSSHYVTRYSEENADLFDIYEIVETQEVSHKRYTE